MNLNSVYETGFDKLYKKLSCGVTVQGTTNHIVDRLIERNIQFATVCYMMNKVIHRNDFCIRDIFESVLAQGKKNFTYIENGIKIMYSVYVKNYDILIVFRSIARKD